jgi:hypothetical protein
LVIEFIDSSGHCVPGSLVFETINIAFGLFCQLPYHSVVHFVVFTLTRTLSPAYRQAGVKGEGKSKQFLLNQG